MLMCGAATFCAVKLAPVLLPPAATEEPSPLPPAAQSPADATPDGSPTIPVAAERVLTKHVIDDPLGTLELGDTQAIVFLVDIGAVPPGTAGTIWIDNLRVY